MPHLAVDLTINVPSLLTFGGAAIAFIWKASAFVAEMRAFREDYEAHKVRFERVETGLEDLRQLAFKKS